MGSTFTVPLSLVVSSRLLVQRCGLPKCGLRDEREHNILMPIFRRLNESVVFQVLDATMQIR
jgi:hypothetical protein